MTDQNSAVVTQIRPEQAMEQLGLKKDAYYEDLKFLGLKAKRDSTGRREGFQVPGELATVGVDDLASQQREEVPVTPESGLDMAALIAEAAELAGSRMTMKEQIVNAIANQMTYEDLPPEVQSKVQTVRASADPKAQQPDRVATALLSQWRQQQAMVAA